MSKLFIYNFNGEHYESTEAFNPYIRAQLRAAVISGEPVSRQVIDGQKVLNERYHPAGIFLAEE
jgi:hypothetical protein